MVLTNWQVILKNTRHIWGQTTDNKTYREDTFKT